MRKVVLLAVLVLLAAESVSAQYPARRRQPSTYTQLGTPPDGEMRYCTNCQATTPCSSGGSGAIAERVGGIWNCSTGSSASAGGNSGDVQINGGGGSLAGVGFSGSGVFLRQNNATFTSPRFVDGGYIADANGNELLIFDSVPSAVNEITPSNAATGNSPALSATGGDTNIALKLTSKGNEYVHVTNNGIKFPDATIQTTAAAATSPGGSPGAIQKNSAGSFGAAIAGTDYENPLTFSSPLSRSTNTISCPTCGVTGTGLNQFASTTSAQFLGIVSNETGSGLVMGNDTPTILTPTIASFANATHSHQNAAGGGSLDAAAIGAGTLADARFPATLPAASGVNLTALNGSNIASGTVADGRIASVLTGKTYNGLTVTNNGTNTLNVAAGKTLTASNSVTLAAGADGVTMTAPATSASLSGVLYVTTTVVGNAAGGGETTLATYTLPANALNIDNKAVRIIVWGTNSATANARTVKLHFGATAITNRANSVNSGNWYLDARVVRVSSTLQTSVARGATATADNTNENQNMINVGAPAETMANTIVIKITGASSAADDMVVKGFIIEILN